MSKIYQSLKAFAAACLLAVPCATQAQEITELPGDYTLTPGEARFVGLADVTPALDATYPVTITVNEAKSEVYMKGFIGTPQIGIYDEENMGMTMVDTCFVGTYSKTENLFLGTIVKVTFNMPAGSGMMLSNGDYIIGADEFELTVKKDKEGAISITSVEDIFFDYTNSNDDELRLVINGITMPKDADDVDPGQPEEPGIELPGTPLTPGDSVDLTKFVGRYEMQLGKVVQMENQWVSAPSGVMKGEIIMNADNTKLLMTGLFGTPAMQDVTGVEQIVQIDSCYVGTYNPATQTVKFVYPIGFDMVDAEYNLWTLKKPFTVEVRQLENGQYAFATAETIYFDCDGAADFAGVTMKQQPTYSIAKEALVGYYEMPYETLDQTNYVDTVAAAAPLTFSILEKEGELFITGLAGSTEEVQLTYRGFGLNLPFTMNRQAMFGVASDNYFASQSPVKFYFTEDGKLELSTNLAIMNQGTQVLAFPGALAVKGIAPPTVNPAPGEYEDLPTVITFTAGQDIQAIESPRYRTQGNPRGTTIPADSIKIAGNVATINFPAELAAQAFLGISFKALLADGSYATYGNTEGYCAFEYEAEVPADTYVLESSKPTQGETVASLKEIYVTFKSTSDRDFVGGFDTSKKVIVSTIAGDSVTIATLSYGEDWTNEAILTLDKEITENGEYIVVIPEGTVYNSAFDESAEDFGVTNGAIYNPGIKLSFIVGTPAPVVSPAPGHYEDLPTVITFTAGMDIKAIENLRYRTQSNPRGALLPTDSIKVAGNVATINLPAELAAEGYLGLNFKALLADDTYATYGNTEGYCAFEYTAEVPVDTYVFESSSPWQNETVASLKDVLLVFKGTSDNDFVGGFDHSKQINVTTANGDSVTICTVSFGADWTNEVILTFDKKITENGSYIVTIPAGTVYNNYFDEYAEDFGVANGARYNPEFKLTFTVDNTTGIGNAAAGAQATKVYTLKGIQVNGKKLEKGIYIINGKKTIVK